MGGYNKRGYLNSDFKIFHLTDQISTEFEFHYHEFHKITIFISGNVQYFVEGKTYPLEPYDIVLVNRNDIHRVQVDPSLPYERIIVYISPGFIDAYRTDDYDLSYCFEKAKKEHSNVLRIHSLEKSSLFKITNRLERSFSDTEYAGSLYRQILFLEFMIHLNRAAIKNRVEFLDTSLYNPKIVDLIQYINQHLTESLDVDFLSSRGLSEQILYDAPLQSGNRIYHRKLYHLPQAFACPHFDPGWDADHAGLPCKRLSGLLHIFTSLQNRISRTTQNAFTSL